MYVNLKRTAFMNDFVKVKKLLIYGMLGAILTMVGDCMLLGVDSTGAVGALGQYIISAGKLSYTRIGFAGFFGFVGIPITAFGFYALYELMENKSSILAKVYKASVYGYVALGGAVHIICCYLVTGIKKALETGTTQENMLTVILNEQGGYVIPCLILFMIFYLSNVITLIIIIASRKTILSGWLWIFNPFIFKILFNLLGKLGTGAFLNGIACSNMSLGALLIFIIWIIALYKLEKS